MSQAKAKTHTPKYSLDAGISGTEFGLLWPVIEDHGRCGCGAVEMKSAVGYFRDRAVAERWIEFLNLPLPSKEEVRYALILNRLAGIESSLDVEIERAGDRGFTRGKEAAARHLEKVLAAAGETGIEREARELLETIRKLEDTEE